MELFQTLGINVGMLVAQLVNYGILLVALSVLLYRPIMKLLDERAARVQKSMEDSKKIELALKDMEKQRTASMKELDTKASQILAEAKKQADGAKSDMMSAAQLEVDSLLERGRKQLEDEKRKMIADLEKTVSRLSVTLAGRILEREFSQADQQRILGGLQKDISSLVQ